MRKSFYTLSGIVTNQIGLDVQDGDAFTFINKTCTSMKVLHVECGGLVIYHLKLERGFRHLPDVSSWEEKQYVGPYLIASGASALTSIPKATMRKNGNCSRTNSAKERSYSIARLPSMSPLNTSFTRQSARTTSKGQSDAQLLLRSQLPRAMRVQPFWPT